VHVLSGAKRCIEPLRLFEFWWDTAAVIAFTD
jgi:hypothetical protein